MSQFHHHHGAHNGASKDESVAAAQAFMRQCFAAPRFVRGEMVNEGSGIELRAAYATDRSHVILATGPAFRRPAKGKG